MTPIRILLACATALCMGAAATAATTDIAGVKVEDSASVAGAKLPLSVRGACCVIFNINNVTQFFFKLRAEIEFDCPGQIW